MTKALKVERSYSKSPAAKATVGESQAIAQAAAVPALVGARFALIVSVLSLMLSGVAVAVAITR
jgi:hypothetical protein